MKQFTLPTAKFISARTYPNLAVLIPPKQYRKLPHLIAELHLTVTHKPISNTYTKTVFPCNGNYHSLAHYVVPGINSQITPQMEFAAKVYTDASALMLRFTAK